MNYFKATSEELLKRRQEIDEEKNKIWQVYDKLYKLDIKELEKEEQLIRTFMFAKSASII